MTNKTITTFQAKDYTKEQLLELLRQLATQFTTLLPAGDTTSRSILAGLQTQIGFLAAIVAREQSNAYTGRREAADEKRDRLSVGLAAKARASLYSPIATEAAAAALVVAEIEKRPAGLQEFSYEENTTQLDLLVTDLDRAAPALATLGLTTWLADLKTANAAFSAIQLESAIAETGLPDLPRLAAVQLRLNEKLRLLLGIVNHFNAEHVAPYPDLMEQLHDRIVAVRAVARARAGEPKAPAPVVPTPAKGD